MTYGFQNERDATDAARLIRRSRQYGDVAHEEPMRQSASVDTRFEFNRWIRVPVGCRATGIYTTTVTVAASPGAIARAIGVVRLVHRDISGGAFSFVYNGPLATTLFAAVPYNVTLTPGNTAYLESVTMTLMIPFTYENTTSSDRMITAESVASIGADYHRLDFASEAYCYKYGSMSTFALTGEE
jgi:hypothetical protein